MPWFTFHRPASEALTVAENIRANYPTFLQRPHWPKESAAVFLRYDHSTGQTHFYFSPAFAEAEPFMVELYLAGVCSPQAPSRTHCWSDKPARRSYWRSK